MAKYIFASVVILLAGVGAVALILFLYSDFKQMTREEMERTRVTVKDAAKDATTGGVGDAVKDSQKAAQDAFGNLAQEFGKTLGKIGEGAKGGGTDKDKEKPVDDKKADAGKPDAKAPSNPNDLVGALFGAAREAAKAADDLGQKVVGMDTAQETRLGKQVAKDVLHDHKVYVNPRQLSRVQRIAAPMLEQRSRKDINYTFTLIDDPEVNAFSHLGGYIYVYRGLLDFCADDNMLQYVLGHEIAHVDLKHCVRGLNYGAKVDEATGGAGGQVVELVYHLIALGYSEDQEFDSDAWSYKTMRKLGKTHDQSILFNRRFLDYLKSKGKPTGKKPAPTSVPGAVLQEVDNHFQSHPSAEERLARLEKMK
jgi:hypothetical protein